MGRSLTSTSNEGGVLWVYSPRGKNADDGETDEGTRLGMGDSGSRGGCRHAAHGRRACDFGPGGCRCRRSLLHRSPVALRPSSIFPPTTATDLLHAPGGVLSAADLLLSASGIQRAAAELPGVSDNDYH